MPALQDRQIRVFVSSTFRDMGAERDHLVKFIFPQLRKLCESRGVTWGEVDLRWGVTDEAAAEGMVLPICLEEIKRCRPYFIGILGERYGWVPESIPQDLIKQEPWLEEQMRGHKSVTELEILHGVLRNPTMAGHAYFYFRDPDYLDEVPKEAKRENFTGEDVASSEKLRQLKQQIKASCFPVRENYADPKALGELVLADLTKVINDTWPEGSQLDSLDREAMDQEAFAQSRAKVYIGRQEYFDRLDAHANGSGDQPIIILGESGSGKSALLANWALKHRAAHPGDFLLMHFIGSTPYSSDWAAMLRRIMGEFKRVLGIAQDIPDQPDALRAAFANWLHMASAKVGAQPSAYGPKIILILDALNQLENRDGAPDLVWLPPVMPENVRLIVSTLPGRALDEVNKRKWAVLKVGALNPAERQQFITGYLNLYTKQLSPARAACIAAAPQSANPLFLRALLEELRIFGEHERLDERISHYLQAETVPELYEKILARWEADYEGDTDLVGDAMSLLWAARRGLSEAELLDALGKENEKGELEPLPRALWSPLFLATSDSLVSRSGLLTFFHVYLLDAVRNAYLPSEDACHAAHRRLADFFQRQTSSPRRTDELPWQLAEARAWEELVALLIDPEFLAQLGQHDDHSIRMFWAKVEANTSFRMVDAYRTQIERAELEPDKHHLNRIAKCFAETGHPMEALKVHNALEKHFRKVGDLSQLQICLSNIADILAGQGELDRALPLAKEHEQISRSLGDFERLQSALALQGRIVRDLGDLNTALALFREGQVISEQHNNREAIAGSLLNQAILFQKHGHYDEALALYKQAEGMARQMENMGLISVSVGNQAIILKDRGELEGAMLLHEEEERICRTLGDQGGLAECLGNQAAISAMLGDVDRVMNLLKAQEEICVKLNRRMDLQRCLGNQANVLQARGDLKGAMKLHKQAEDICREINFPDGLQTSLWGQARVLHALGDLDNALVMLKEQERICRGLDHLLGLANGLFERATILRERGDDNGAFSLLKESEKICRDMGIKRGLAESLEEQAVVLLEREDLDGAVARFEEAEHICRELGDENKLASNLGKQADAVQGGKDIEKAITLREEESEIYRQLGNFDLLAKSLLHRALSLAITGQHQQALALAGEARNLIETYECPQHVVEWVEQVSTALEHRLSLLNEQGGSLTTPLESKESSTEDLYEMARRVFQKGQWEGAETMFQKLLDRGEPLQTMAPDLITALLNAHAEPLPATIARVQKLISELEDHGHFDLALAARRQLEAKLPQPKKPWWKIW